MVYHNQSNSTLDSIVIHLWPNAYKNSSTELANKSMRTEVPNLNMLKSKIWDLLIL